MKNVLFPLILLVLSLGPLRAQENVDTNYYDPPDKMDRFIFDLGHARWLDAPKGIDVEPWSYSIAVHYMKDIPFGESGFATAIGLGFSSHNVFHNGFFHEPVDDDEPTDLVPYGNGNEPDKNKLSSNYLDVPVELRFRTSGSTAFKISLGARIGYLVNLHQKIIDENGKRKFYDIEGVDPLRYGTYARIGVGRWNVFAYYAIPSVFKEGEGPEMHQVSAGLSFTLF
jgi:hypothetical protein